MNDTNFNVNLNIDASSLNNALYNLTDEPTKIIGKTIADGLELIFGKISNINEIHQIKRKALVQEVYNELINIPPDDLVEPNLHTLFSALENAKYCFQEDDLRKMFVKLLSSSIHKDTSDFTHPSFSFIITQMSSLDAHTLMHFKNVNTIPLCDIHPSFKRFESTKAEKEMSISIISLIRLGLIEEVNITSVTDNTETNLMLSERGLASFDPHNQIQVSEHCEALCLTKLGEAFCQVCI